MRTRLLIVMLVLGLMATGFSALNLPSAAAGLPHVVDGAVGPSVAPGLGNPSNPASAAFYLVNKPAEAIQVQADIADADGVGTAYYGADVGSGWSWAAGDQVVVVVETIRGVNSWAGANYTTSSDGVLTVNNVDSLPNANIEAMPTLALNKGPTYVNVTWTGLADGNGNVVDYRVQRARDLNPSSFATIGRSGPQVPGGAMSFDDTNLGGNPTGLWCYRIAAGYRSGAVGGVYNTTGTSEPQCVTIGLSPTIVSTSPADGETNVALTANIVVTFDQAMDPSSLTPTISPIVTLVAAWDITFRVVTLTHVVPFTQCRSYTVSIAARDADDGFPLMNGPVPNPWTFTTVCPSPQITTTSPANNAVGVPIVADVVITFSKQMDTTSLLYLITPSVSMTESWNFPTDTVVTLAHSTTPFAAATQYTVDVTQARDTFGNDLVAGPVPNPWIFTTNAPPQVTITPPFAGQSWSCASLHDIGWTMTDDATPASNLIVTIRYEYSGGTLGGTILPAQTGRTSPDVYSWTVASINAADVVVIIEVEDATGDVGSASSGTFEIDCADPSVSSVSPASGAGNVAIDADIVITFSEGMAEPATQGATTILPAITLSPSWNAQSTVLTLTHTNPFTVNTQYTVTIATTARDDSSPGRTLQTEYQWQFTVSARTPSPPTGLSISGATPSSLTLTWNAPTTYTDSSTLLEADIAGYWVYRATSPSTPASQRTNLTSGGMVTAKTYVDTGVAAATTYYYWVVAVLNNGRFSAESAMAQSQTQPAPSDLGWLLWLLLAIIAIVVVVILVVAMRRRKKPEAVAPPEEAAPPAAEAEEPPPTEEEGGGESEGEETR